MQAGILKKSEEREWEKFIKSHPLATIHQTPEWGKFRGKYWIIAVKDNGKIIGGSMIIRHSLPKGYCWLYAARGPLIQNGQFDAFLKALKDLAKKEKAIFLRIDPPIKIKPEPTGTADTPELAPAASPLRLPKGFKPVHHGFQPEHTLIIDLTPPEEEILKQMKPKGRYNIRLAERKGVKIEESKDVDAFYSLLEKTTSRDNFRGHDKEFYRRMLNTMPKYAKLYLAKYKGKAIAGIIVTRFKDTTTYYFGASGNKHRNLMAPYLLQWYAMKEARKEGMKEYDMLGIAPPNAKNHPWAGVTKFKEKFGGFRVAYAPAKEYAFKKISHTLYNLYKKAKRL